MRCFLELQEIKFRPSRHVIEVPIGDGEESHDQ